MASGKKGVEVFIRKRPLLENDEDVVFCEGINKLVVSDRKTRVDLTSFEEQHVFYFDRVINDKTNVIPITEYVSHAMSGNSSLIFCYGQTGSGKSYTMLSDHGLVYTGLADILTFCSISLSIFEIYQNNVHDLLNNRSKCDLREYQGNMIVKNLVELVVEIKCLDKAKQIIEKALESRSTSSTNQNVDSSRSHAIIQCKLNGTLDISHGNKRRDSAKQGTLMFIDLAGSEKANERGDTSQKIRSEGADINKSLLALKECIRAMDQKKGHTPFRQSKLTMVLRDGFVGSARTLMIACIAPNKSNCEHTLNTLRYADRVKELDEEKVSNGKMNATYSNFQSQPNQDPMSVDSIEDDSLIDVHEGVIQSPEKSYLSSNVTSQPNLTKLTPRLGNRSASQNGLREHVDTSIPRKTVTKSTSRQFETKTANVNKLPYAGGANRPPSADNGNSSNVRKSAAPFPVIKRDLNTKSAIPMRQQPAWDSSSPQVVTPPNASTSPSGSPSLLSPNIPQAEIRDKMDKFIIEHRKYIRNFSDMYKKDMDVLAQLTLSLSSQKDTRLAFDEYLKNVDELAERKILYANTLRQYIHSLK